MAKLSGWLLVLLFTACNGDGERMSQTLTYKAKGLYTSPNEIGETPDGALSQADNVVVSRDGIVETRRGESVAGTKALSRAFAYKSALVGHDGTSTLSYSSDSGATWTNYSVPVTPQTGEKVRAVEAASNLFVTDATATKRIDALAGTPEDAGVPAALDVELTLSSAGSPTALPNNKRMGYRVLFGKKDANKRLLLGAPSGRAVVTNTAGATRDVTVAFSLPRGLDSSHFYQVYRTQSSVDQNTDPGDEMGLVLEGAAPIDRTISSLSRTSNVVTAATTETHGYSTGQTVRVGPGGSVGGSIVAVGFGVAATSPDGIAWTNRTQAGSMRAAAWNGSVIAAVGDSASGSTTPDGLTWTPRTLPAGSYAAVAWGSGKFVAVGSTFSAGVCATSPDGITWTARTIGGVSWESVVWTGSQFVAVGSSGGATSPDGITWTARTMPAGATFYAVGWNGSLLVAVSAVGTGATSTDGVTWTGMSLPTATVWRDVVWSGTRWVAVGASVSAYSTNGTSWTSASISGTYYSVIWDGSQFVANGDGVVSTSAAGSSWTPRTPPTGTMSGLVLAGTSFAASEYTITGTPAANTFTYAETGADGTLTQAQTATPLVATALDTVPDSFLGAYLYTNPNQEGILNANERPVVAKDLAVYRETLFQANVTTPARATAYLLSTGGTNGVVAGDTVTINGLVYTAAASESISARQFKVFTAGTVSENIRDTAASLIRVVNRSLSSGATIVDLSGPDDVPGILAFKATDAVSPLTITFSRSTAWSPSSGISENPSVFKNGLVWAKQGQPDSIPTSNVLLPKRIGSDDKEIRRIIPTRSSLFILKDDGIWRLQGDAGNWDIQPFDPTIRIVAPESAVVLDNTIWALSEQGTVRISDTGVAVLSRPVEDRMVAAISPAMRATTASRAFGVGYESDRKYLLFLPSSSSDTQATQAYVYDLFTQAWTRRTGNASHGLVNPADDRLYLVDGASVLKERKDFADSDYQGPAGAAISTVVGWSPKFGASPGALSELQEVVVFWDRVQFTTATLSFSTNLSQTPESITLNGSDYGWDSAVGTQAELRAWPPAEKTWGSQFNITLSHAQAGKANAISGLAVTFASQSTVVSR
jgi:hypothetical protein